MYWIDWLLIVLATLFFLNLLFLTAYCWTKRRLDGKKRLSKTEQTDYSDSVAPAAPKKNGLKQLLGTLEPYLYGWMRYSTVMFGKLPSHTLRNLLFHYIFAMNITRNTVIYGGCEIRSPWNITADRCVISTYCILDGRNGIFFGDDVVLGSGVHIWTEEHNVDDPLFRVLAANQAPVRIGNHAWICSDVTLLPGVTVGEGAVIASRGCLTKDAEPFYIYGGVPAKKLRQRNNDLQYKLNGKPTWHFY